MMTIMMMVYDNDDDDDEDGDDDDDVADDDDDDDDNNDDDNYNDNEDVYEDYEADKRDRLIKENWKRSLITFRMNITHSSMRIKLLY